MGGPEPDTRTPTPEPRTHMYRWMQKNSRKMLAIFAVLLMIVFIMPTDCRRNALRNEAALGHIGKEPVTVADVQHYMQEWALLRDHVLMPGAGNPGAPEGGYPIAGIFGPDAVTQISSDRNRP